MPQFRPSGRLLRAYPSLFKHTTRAPHPQLVHIQHVNFTKTRNWRTASYAFAAMIMGWVIYDRIVLAPLTQAISKHLEGLYREELKELEDSRSPIFIPLPFTTRLVRPPPYASTDPEWQTFCKLSRDQEKLNKIRVQLATLMRDAAARTTSITNQLGTDLQVDHYWFDIKFPLGPPRECWRKGFVVLDDSVAIVEKRMPGREMERLDRALFPTSLALSMWSFGWFLLKQHVQDAARALGLSSSPSQQGTVSMPSTALKDKMQNRQPTIKDAARGMPPPNEIATGPVTDNPNKPVPVPSGPRAGDENLGRPQDWYPYENMRNRIKGGWREFYKTWNQRWRPHRVKGDYSPRGSIYVQGTLNLKSPKGWISLYCDASWDPKTNEYERIKVFSSAVTPRTLTPLR